MELLNFLKNFTNFQANAIKANIIKRKTSSYKAEEMKKINTENFVSMNQKIAAKFLKTICVGIYFLVKMQVPGG